MSLSRRAARDVRAMFLQAHVSLTAVQLRKQLSDIDSRMLALRADMEYMRLMHSALTELLGKQENAK
jgi:hypothetical protein